MRILVALGGNALLRRDEVASAANQRRHVEDAAAALADLTAEHEVIITHDGVPRIGHMLELALRNLLPERDVISVLTQVVVTSDEPEPNAIAEIRSLRVLVDSGALVICTGGSGVPIALNGDGTMHRVETAVDKDLTAALLARRLDADLLLMLTDVDAVYRDWGSPGKQPVAGAEPAELRGMHLAEETIGPKVEAACRFAATTGRRAAIGSLDEIDMVVRAEAGTQVVSPAAEPMIAAERRLPQS
jgi:carbamate kinase